MNFALDPVYHDLYLNADGSLATTDDVGTPLDQRIDCRIRTFLGEFWQDISIGIDFFGLVFVKTPDIGTIRNAFSLEIQKVQGVKTVNSLDVVLDRANRSLTVTFSVTGTDDLVYYRTTEVSQ